ncbi:MAG TPA: hypothetical protein VEP90_11295 [Methylomirabilota bacterium]|nr:hypothetical protein [Methylomirabilota bacterium]
MAGGVVRAPPARTPSTASTDGWQPPEQTTAVAQHHIPCRASQFGGFLFDKRYPPFTDAGTLSGASPLGLLQVAQ